MTSSWYNTRVSCGGNHIHLQLLAFQSSICSLALLCFDFIDHICCLEEKSETWCSNKQRLKCFCFHWREPSIIYNNKNLGPTTGEVANYADYITFACHYQGSVDFKTNCLIGVYLLTLPHQGWIDDEAHCLKSWGHCLREISRIVLVFFLAVFVFSITYYLKDILRLRYVFVFSKIYSDYGLTSNDKWNFCRSQVQFLIRPVRRKYSKIWLINSKLKTLPEAQRTQKLTPWLGLNLATTWHYLH